jgi:hypothetical protein
LSNPGLLNLGSLNLGSLNLGSLNLGFWNLGFLNLGFSNLGFCAWRDVSRHASSIICSTGTACNGHFATNVGTT